jgi:hypothetical protein
MYWETLAENGKDHMYGKKIKGKIEKSWIITLTNSTLTPPAVALNLVVTSLYSLSVVDS